MRRLFVIASLLCCQYVALAQYDSRYYENITHAHYSAREWDSLIYSAEEAIGAGFESFYIRLRLGAAWYAKADYAKAVRHLEAARKFNATDEFANTLLFAAYMNIGRISDAQYIVNKGIAAKNNPFPLTAEVSLNGGGSITDIASPLETSMLVGNGKIHGLAHTTASLTFAQAGAQHYFGKRSSLFHSFSILELNKRLYEGFPFGDTTISYKAVQHQYYAAFQHRLSKGLFFSPAIHVLKHQTSIPYNIYNTLTGRQETYYFDTSFVNFHAGAKLSYYISNWLVECGGSISNFNGNRFMQYDLLGRRHYGNFYLSLGLHGHIDSITIHTLVSAMAWFKVKEKMTVTAYALAGDYSNMAINHSYLVFNVYERARLRAGIEMRYTFSKRIDAQLNYTWSRKAYPYYYEKNDLLTREAFKDYNTNTINGGIIWKFY